MTPTFHIYLGWGVSKVDRSNFDSEPLTITQMKGDLIDLLPSCIVDSKCLKEGQGNMIQLKISNEEGEYIL